MKIHEALYITGIFLIFISITIYALSTTMIPDPDEDSISNLLGKTTEIDSSFTVEEALTGVYAQERHGNAIFLWIGISSGIVIFIAGLVLKRKQQGPDLFIDDELDEQESDFPFF